MIGVAAREVGPESPAAWAEKRLLARVVNAPSALRAPLLAPRIIALRGLLPRVLEVVTLPELLDALSAGARRLWPAPSEAVEATERAVERWLRPGTTLTTTCLYRALVRYVLLRELGLDVTFVMGVRTEGDELLGHAWLELDGQPLRETLKARYTPTFSHPRRGR